MTTLMRQTDARIRIANTKIEMIATEIAHRFDDVDMEKTDTLIDQLYNKTRAIRAVAGVDRRAYACIKTFLDTFNLNEFVNTYGG